MQSTIYQEWIQEDIKEAVTKAVTKAVSEAVTETESKTNVKATARAIMEVLEERFDYLRRSTREKLNAIQDIDRLNYLLKKSVKVSSPEEFDRILEEPIP